MTEAIKEMESTLTEKVNLTDAQLERWIRAYRQTQVALYELKTLERRKQLVHEKLISTIARKANAEKLHRSRVESKHTDPPTNKHLMPDIDKAVEFAAAAVDDEKQMKDALEAELQQIDDKIDKIKSWLKS